MLLNSPVKTVAFVNKQNAISAGALISLAAPGAPSEKQVIRMDWSAPVRAFVEQLGRSEAPPAERPARAPHRYSRQTLMGTKRHVQNAVVIATILGPCRALSRPTLTGGEGVGAGVGGRGPTSGRRTFTF
ncbi:MAG TPA: hypothetical protein VGE16_16105 [Albitalea sp.]